MPSSLRKPKRRKLFAAMAGAAGLSLFLFEVRTLAGGGGGESWFWLVVGLLAAVIGMVELMSRQREE